jgi:hypothetical protein
MLSARLKRHVAPLEGRRMARMRAPLILALCLVPSLPGLEPWPLGLAPLSAVASAQQLIDRVVARVNGMAVTLTDVQAAIGLGVVEPVADQDAEKSATEQLVERALLLNEVERFPPPEPTAAEIDKQVAAYVMHAGAQLAALEESTGIDDRAIRNMARDSLRIQAYLSQRFGTAAVVTDEEAQQYYDAHPAEFTRNGRLQPFDAVEADARQRAAADRRRTTIAQWLRDLRARADIVEVARR